MNHDIYFEPPSKSERDAVRREEIALRFAVEGYTRVVHSPSALERERFARDAFYMADAFLDEAKMQREAKP